MRMSNEKQIYFTISESEMAIKSQDNNHMKRKPQDEHGSPVQVVFEAAVCRI